MAYCQCKRELVSNIHSSLSRSLAYIAASTPSSIARVSKVNELHASHFNFFDCQLNKLQELFYPTKNIINDSWLPPVGKFPYEASICKTNFKFLLSFWYFRLYEFDVTFSIIFLQNFISSMVAFPNFDAKLLTSKLISGLQKFGCWSINVDKFCPSVDLSHRLLTDISCFIFGMMLFQSSWDCWYNGVELQIREILLQSHSSQCI